MSGREDKKSNDLFYTCSLIGYIARKTGNKPSHIVSMLGKEAIFKIYELADVYHSDNRTEGFLGLLSGVGMPYCAVTSSCFGEVI